MKLPVPKRVQERLAPLVERTQAFLKTWEWTWTSAVVASVIWGFFALTFLALVPSWWLYFADQTLRWRTFWLLKIRDAIAAGEIVTAFAVMFAAAYILQTARQKLRGASAEHRTGGYR
jgi:hypothetical protein